MPTPIEAATAAVTKTWYHLAHTGQVDSPENFSEILARSAVMAAVESMDFESLLFPALVEPERSTVINLRNLQGGDGEAEMRELERRAKLTSDYIKIKMLSGI